MDGRLTAAVRDVFEGDDFHEGDDARPGVGQRRRGGGTWVGEISYKKPKLMASMAPNFSRLLIATFQTIFHGMMARTISMMPE